MKKRVYFFHIRKTGGQSIYHAILEQLCRGIDPAKAERWLTRAGVLACMDKLIVGWGVEQINRQDWHFGFSHVAMHELLPMPSDTFTFACFREPSERVISHYRMLKMFRETKTRHDVLQTECKWVRKTFAAFLDAVPPHHLMTQLRTFSAGYDPQEALDNVAKLDYFFHLEDFSVGLAELGKRIGPILTGQPMVLREKRVMQSHAEFDGTQVDRDRLRKMLEPEYEFWEGLKSL